MNSQLLFFRPCRILPACFTADPESILSVVKIYEATHFSDFRIYSEKGFSKDDLQSVLSIDGVKDAARYLSINTSVKDDTDVIALTVSENMNAVFS